MKCEEYHCLDASMGKNGIRVCWLCGDDPPLKCETCQSVLNLKEHEHQNIVWVVVSLIVNPNIAPKLVVLPQKGTNPVNVEFITKMKTNVNCFLMRRIWTVGFANTIVPVKTAIVKMMRIIAWPKNVTMMGIKWMQRQKECPIVNCIALSNARRIVRCRIAAHQFVNVYAMFTKNGFFCKEHCTKCCDSDIYW